VGLIGLLIAGYIKGKKIKAAGQEVFEYNIEARKKGATLLKVL
jgi:hypothetical protein